MNPKLISASSAFSMIFRRISFLDDKIHTRESANLSAEYFRHELSAYFWLLDTLISQARRLASRMQPEDRERISQLSAILSKEQIVTYLAHTCRVGSKLSISGEDNQ